MSEVLDNYVLYLQGLDRSPLTVKGYQRDIQAFFTWLEAQLGRPVPPIEVTTFDIQRYRDGWKKGFKEEDKPGKPAAINRRLAALRSFFGWALKKGLVGSNPVEDVQWEAQGKRSPKSLTQQEVYQLQREAASQRQLAEVKAGAEITPTLVDALRDEAILNLLVYGGLRVAEVAALKVGDLQFTARRAKVIVREGKGRKYREVPIHPNVRKMLEAYLAVRPKDQGDALFLGQRGALSTRGIQFRIEAIGEAAKIKVTCHVLRHTCATRMLRESKADLVTVADILGHSNINTTMIYTQPGEEDKFKAVEGMS